MYLSALAKKSHVLKLATILYHHQNNTNEQTSFTENQII